MYGVDSCHLLQDSASSSWNVLLATVWKKKKEREKTLAVFTCEVIPATTLPGSLPYTSCLSSACLPPTLGCLHVPEMHTSEMLRLRAGHAQGLPTHLTHPPYTLST